MSSRTGSLLVVDEWLLHDLMGDPKDQSNAYRFLTTLQQLPDRIVVADGSPWMGKAFTLMRDSGRLGRPELRELSKLMHSVLQDLSSCLRIEAVEESQLNPDTAKLLPRKDLYLVETYLRSSADLLVTHDRRLLTALSQHCPQIATDTKAAFLAKYLSKV